MWKRALFWMGIFALVCSCQQELYEMEGENVEEGERFPVSFSLSIEPEVFQETEIVPMTRADAEVYKTSIHNRYKLIVIKYTKSKWIIDQVLDPTFREPKEHWSNDTIYIANDGMIGKTEIELRPGKYQMAAIVNMSHGILFWNQTIKPGAVISIAENISPEEDLPAAFTYFENTDSAYMRQTPIFVNREVFTGNVAFTVDKAGELKTSNGTPPEIQLERRVGQFRFLLQEQQDGNIPPFKNTQHTFDGIFNSPEGMYFPVGINVLGGVYYNRQAPAKALRIKCTDGGTVFHRSSKDGKYYRLPVISGTVYAPYIILDKKVTDGMTCMLDHIQISGQSEPGGFQYFADPIEFLLKVNTIFGAAFETTDQVWALPSNYWGIHINALKEIDVSTWFSPYFQWNQ